MDGEDFLTLKSFITQHSRRLQAKYQPSSLIGKPRLQEAWRSTFAPQLVSLIRLRILPHLQLIMYHRQMVQPQICAKKTGWSQVTQALQVVQLFMVTHAFSMKGRCKDFSQLVILEPPTTWFWATRPIKSEAGLDPAPWQLVTPCTSTLIGMLTSLPSSSQNLPQEQSTYSRWHHLLLSLS